MATRRSRETMPQQPPTSPTSNCSSAAAGNPSKASRWGDVFNPSTRQGHRQGAALRRRRSRSRPCQAAAAALPAWAETPAVDRARVMFRFRELLNTHFEELAALVTREHGKTLGRSARQRAARHRDGRVRLRHPQPAHGPAPGEHRHQRRLRNEPASGRRLRRHHAVQLPGDGAAVDVPRRHHLRQHVRPEAVGKGAALRRAAGRTADRSRPARRACSTSCTATRNASTRCSRIRWCARFRSSARTAVAKHVYETGTRTRQARAGGRRREEPSDHHARRRSRSGRQGDSSLGLRLRRRTLHGRQRGRAGRQHRRSAGRRSRAKPGKR